MMKPSRGLTLPELLVALAVLAIVIAVAVPSFRSLIEVQRLRSINSQLVTDLQFARNEAATRGVPLRVIFDSNADATCYSLYTSAGTGLLPANNLSCNCLAGPGNACTGIAGTVEVKSVLIPRSLGVIVRATSGMSAFAFDPATGGLLTIPQDQPSLPLDLFRTEARIDLPRRLVNLLNQSGRPTVCSPAGTTMGETPCP
jgi:type IV fimbrial biogenesis protein FimT